MSQHCQKYVGVKGSSHTYYPENGHNQADGQVCTRPYSSPLVKKSLCVRGDVISFDAASPQDLCIISPTVYLSQLKVDKLSQGDEDQ